MICVTVCDSLTGYRTWKTRIRACVLGREAIYGGSDIVIIARTDAMAVEGYDAALERVSRCELGRSDTS